MRPFSKFKNKDIGEYISFGSNDIATISQDLVPPFINLSKSLLMFFIYGVILVVLIDWRIALVLFAASIVFTALTHLTSKELGKSRSAFLKKTAEYTAVLQDLLRGRKKVSSRTITNISSRHELFLKKAATARLRYGKQKTISLSLNGLFTYAINVSTFITVAFLLYNRKIGIGTAVAALAYIECFVSPLKEILYDLTSIQSVKDVQKKVDEEIAYERFEQYPPKSSDIFSQSIDIEGISYSVGDHFVLKIDKLRLLPNKKYAIIGSNGSGKSTLLNLLLNRFTVEAGGIYIDGTNIKDIDLAHIIGILDQDEHIFSAGFSDNVTVFSSYDIKSIKTIIENSSLKEKPNVTDNKNCQNTSGGEQRLLGLFRLLSQDTPVCLLDEPFAGIDDVTSRDIQSLIYGLSNRTLVVVTHDLTDTLRYYDEIIVMDSGSIALVGNYATISESPQFFKIKTSQKATFGDSIE